MATYNVIFIYNLHKRHVILFIFLCYWALKGCSGNTSKVIDDIKVTQPEVVIDTTHSSEDACGEGDIPINQDYFDDQEDWQHL